MKLYNLLILIFVLSCSTIQKNTPIVKEAETNKTNNMMWIARKGDIRIILVGTMHVDIPISHDIESYIKWADKVFVEANESHIVMATQMTNDYISERIKENYPGFSAKEYLSKKAWLNLRHALSNKIIQNDMKELGINVSVDNLNAPLILYLYFKTLLDPNAQNIFPDYAKKIVWTIPEECRGVNKQNIVSDEIMDSQIEKIAYRYKKPVDSLDKLETSQAWLFYDSPYSKENSVEVLKNLFEINYKSTKVVDLGCNEDKQNTLKKLYLKQDTDGIKNYLEQITPERIRHEVLLVRNWDWASLLRREVSDGYKKIFVAAGIGHLLGNGSLLVRLKEEGFEIE